MKDKKALGTQRPQQTPNPANQSRNSLPWTLLEQQVVRMQKQISQACQRGDKQAVHTLQQRLMESEAARLLAVRRATEENRGKDTAGVDGVKSLTSQERLAMASAIHPKNWNNQPPMPVRRVWISKPGTAERRPLAILPMIDRCKQALVKLALEPEWEARFEPHSYGFRPGRSTHDAIAAILVAIERRPTFVFDADIEAAFDHVNQAVVLDKLQTSPALRQTINAWLTAGVIDGGAYFPSATGIAQGGVLSPLLMNIALHGMEAVVTEGSANSHTREQPLLVRYADDFVILHADLKELQQAVRRVKHWLARMGLHLHADKTRFTHTLTPYQGQIGFDFLGFSIRQEPVEKNPIGKSEQGHLLGSKTIITSRTRRLASQERSPAVKTIISPSQEANKRHLAAIEQRLQQLQTAPQARVIAELNPLIVGWAAYYNGVVPAATMSRYDDLIEQRLINWASKRHPGKARDWLLSRYWHRIGNNRSIFATSDGVQLRTYQQTSILRR
ncbi:MAG: reverse transcriptase domain-containing protein [Ktedonobacteraceae bacterium]